MGIKVISKNKKAFHNYEIGDSMEAGIELLGTEVKALRAAKVNLGDGWVDIVNNSEAYLREVHIGHYSHGNIMNHEERRDRRLLLHKREIHKLIRAIDEKGYSVVPLKIYFKGRYIKIEIALGKGKKSYDKRESSKKKDANREISRALKQAR
ncbi:MAG: SsrA-binding protein SmpB [Oligoflexus sp.]